MKVVLEKTGFSVEIEKENGGYYVEADTSRSAGCLHFTHEFFIHVNLANGKIQFLGGDEIACEDIEYTADKYGRDFFEYIHPGVLQDIETYLVSISD